MIKGWGIPMLFCVGLFFGILFTSLLVNHYWRADAIKRGQGQYSPQTGLFEWLPAGIPLHREPKGD